MPFAAICVLLLLPAPAAAWNEGSGWGQMNRDVDIANLWDQFTNRHYGGVNNALMWPGGWDIDGGDGTERRSGANYKGFVIGAMNVRDPQYPDVFWPYMVGQRDGQYDGERGDAILTAPPNVDNPGVTVQILYRGRMARRTFRQPNPVVTVDGQVGHPRLRHLNADKLPPGWVGYPGDDAYQFDVTDPNIPCDLQLETRSATRMGASNNRMIYSFVDRRNDDYMFWHWRLINDGIWGRMHADHATVHDTVRAVMFSLMFQWDKASRGAIKTNSAQTNNDTIWNYYGADYDAPSPTEDMRLVWVRDGDQDPSNFAGYSNGSLDDTGDPDPVTGELLTAKDGGLLLLHFDESTTDRRDDRGQPLTIGWVNYNRLIQTGTQGMQMKYDQMRWGVNDASGVYFYGDYPETPLRGRHPYADSHGASWIKASNDPIGSGVYWPGKVLGVDPEVTDCEQQFGYGPNDIPPDHELNMLYVLGQAGVDPAVCISEGARWLRAEISDAQKNALVRSAKDSLFKTMRQAKSVYESAQFDDGHGGQRYASTRDEFETALGMAVTAGRLALSPPAPATFTVNTAPDHAELSWTLNTSLGSSIAGWRIYRALGSYKGDSVFTKIADLPAATLSYLDNHLTPGYPYYYYLTTYDAGGAESMMHTRTHIPVVTTLEPQVTEVSGTITTTTWTKSNSPYRVTGTITVPSGNTLTIEPGVDVLFDADVQFRVEGSLHGVGTETDSIRFVKGTASEWGGIRISGGDSSTIVYARISDGNVDGVPPPDDTGGGIHMAGTGTRLGIAHAVISGNSAPGGGGVHNSDNARLTMTNCTVSGNSAPPGGGGGVYNVSATATMTNCTISGNSTGGGGGGVYNASATATMTMTNCTISGNSASYEGGGVYNPGGTLTMTNCVLWGDSPQEIVNDNPPGTITATYSDIQGGYTGIGNISADPLFVNAAAGDYHLQAGSPCIDTGDPASPKDPDSTRADMGAFYFPQQVGRPVWAARPDTSTDENVRLMFGVSATDPDGQSLTYGAVSLSAGAAFSAAARVFDWTPTYEQSGVYGVILSVSDGAFTVRDTIGITVNNVNRAPVWAARADTSTGEGVRLTFRVSATDPDGQTLSYRAPTVPSGATFDTSSHVFDWTPTYAQNGQYDVRFSVTDGEFTVYDTVGIRVIDVNRSPVWTTRADTTTSEGVRLAFTVSATDPDGDTLSYRAPAIPTGAAFDTSSHVFDWIPDYTQSGEHEAILSVTDGDFAVYDTVRITVNDVNCAPVWASRPDTSTSEGVQLTFTVSATDADGQTLSYRAPTIPSGATFDTSSHMFDWTPSFDQAGQYDVRFSVTDGEFTVYDTVRITVTDVNRAPVWASRADTSTNEGVRLTFTVSATDPDGQDLTYWMPVDPRGAAFVTTTRDFVWIPDYHQAGDTIVVFRVSDGLVAVDDTVRITVINRPAPPVWQPRTRPDTTIAETQRLVFTVVATDPDGDALSYAAVALPPGAAFDTTNRTFAWTPGYEFVRWFVLVRDTVAVFSVSDGTFAVNDTVGMYVMNVNRPPVWAARPDTSTDEAVRLAFSVSATDPDGQTLIYTPSQTFDWTPPYDFVRWPATARDTLLVFGVSDGDTTVSDTVLVTVNNANRPPMWSPRADTVTAVGKTLTFTVSASDPDVETDGQSLTYTMPTFPVGATFNPTPRSFTWSPGSGQEGDAVVVFRVSDGFEDVDDEVRITVRPPNAPPSAAWAVALPDTVSWGVAFAVAVSDPDNDPVRLLAECSTDGVAWKSAAVSGDAGFGSTPRQAAMTWNTAADLPGKTLSSSVRLRLIPTDGLDNGDSLKRTLTVLNLPCDWDRDGKVGLGDFATLANARDPLDTTRNIGPYSVASGGAVPNIVPVQDGKIDIRDLMAFALLWDWALPRGRVKHVGGVVAKLAAGALAAPPVRFEPVAGSTGLVEVRCATDAPDGALGILMAFPDEVRRGLRFEASPDLFSLTWQDTTAGTVEVWLAGGAGLPGSAIGMLHTVPSTAPFEVSVVCEHLACGDSAPVVASYWQRVVTTPCLARWAIHANAPNPFNAVTTIRYDVPVEARVSLRVFNLAGQQVAVLVDGEQGVGMHVVSWDGTDASGRHVASGVYVVELKAERARVMRKMVVVR